MLISGVRKYRLSGQIYFFKKGPNTRGTSVSRTIDTENFEVVSRFLENVWTHFLVYLFIYFLLLN